MPKESTIRDFIRCFDENERYGGVDKAIRKLLQKFPSNSDFTAVLLKVTTINKLYSTNIMSPFDVAKHIASLQIDQPLKHGKLSAVDTIRHVTISRKEKDFYSFATKYCNWHNFRAYPIYDSFVEKSLRHFNCVTGNLRVYQNLKASVDCFRTQNEITNFNYKQIDKFLWLYGKDELD